MSEEKRQCDSKTCSKESCAGCSSAKGGGIPKETLNEHSKIKKVIGVVSGKGGVGKSFVTASQVPLQTEWQQRAIKWGSWTQILQVLLFPECMA